MYTLRDKNGILMGEFEGAGAANIMECAEGHGHWRPYQSTKMKYPVDAYEIDEPFIMGRDNIHGKLAWYVWEGSLIIPK
jgi:hypothetical protein